MLLGLIFFQNFKMETLYCRLYISELIMSIKVILLLLLSKKTINNFASFDHRTHQILILLQIGHKHWVNLLTTIHCKQ